MAEGGGVPNLSKLRILYVVHGHPDFSPGGGELAAAYSYEVFKQNDSYDPYFVARVDSSLGPHPGTALLRHERDPHTYFLCTPQDQYDFLFESFLPGSPDTHRTVLSSFKELLVSIRPHIVHFHHYHKMGIDLVGYVHQVLPEARIVVTLHDYIALCAHSGSMITRDVPHRLCSKPYMLNCIQCFPKRSANDFFLRKHHIMKNFEHVDLFVSPSRFLKKRYEDWGVEPERIIHLANGRPIWDQDPQPPRSDQRFVVSFFGQIVFHKGVDVLLRAAREYAHLRERALQTNDSSFPDVCFVISGKFGNLQSDLRETIDRLLEECREVVAYTGQYEPDQMPRMMAGVDAVVVPSIWWENAPLVIQEAFMANKPVICSNIGGCAEHVVDYENGLHFIVGNHFDLLNKILELARSPQLYAKLQEGVPQVMSDDEMYEELDRHYRRIVRDPSRFSTITAKPGA